MRFTLYDKVNLIAAYHFIVGGLYILLGGAIILLPTLAAVLRTSEFLARLPGWFLGLGLLLIGGLVFSIGLANLVIGWGLWQLQHWGRMAAMIAAIFRIPIVPIGTIAGGAILYVLLQDEVRALFPRPLPPPAPPTPLFRLALFSDIHGNPIALDAVLADIENQGGVDAYWVLGDLAALGPDPLGALDRLAALPQASFVRGNTDRYVVEGYQPAPAEAELDRGEIALPAAITASFTWTEAKIKPAGWLDWLADLPLEQRLVLPDGTRLLGVHAAPGADDGDGIHPGLSDEELADLLAGSGADLVFTGHTHWPLDRSVNGVRVVNLGSVSNPLAPDLRASYFLLNVYETGYQLAHRRVPYDLRAVLRAIDQSDHPAREYLAIFFRGLRQPEWKVS